MAGTKSKTIFGILFLGFIFFVIMMILAAYTVSSLKDGDSISFGEEKASEKEIAVIEIKGPIFSSKNTVELLLAAEKDEDVKAIVLRINSPGGSVGPTQEIYEEIRRIDGAYDPTKEVNSEEESEQKNETIGKPIYASMGAIAASGGYYLAAATRKIYANPGTLTGSIGVIMQFADLSKLYQWAKIKPYNITAGRYKDTGTDQREMSEEEKDMLRGLLSRTHQQFIRDILKLRKDKIIGDINELAQGQIFSGEDAKKYGLVDELTSLWGAGRQIHKELGLEGEFGFRYIKKKKKSSFIRVLDRVADGLADIDLNSLSDRSPKLLFQYE